jgi:hypothetical protein
MNERMNDDTARRTHARVDDANTPRTPNDDALLWNDDVHGVVEDDHRRREAGNDDENACV